MGREKNMPLKKTLIYICFTITLSIWFVSLLTVCSISKEISTFPSTVDASIIAVFLVSAVLSAVTSFSIGLNKLGILPRARATFVEVRCGNCGFLNLIPVCKRWVFDKSIKCEKCGKVIVSRN